MDFQKEDIKTGAASSLGPHQREGPAHTEQLQRTADLARLDASPSHHHKDPHHTSTRHYTQTRSPLVGQQTLQPNMYPNFLLHLLTFGPTSVSSSRHIQTFHSNGERWKVSGNTHRAPSIHRVPQEKCPSRHTCRTTLNPECSVQGCDPSPRPSSSPKLCVVTQSVLSLHLFLYFSHPSHL